MKSQKNNKKTDTLGTVLFVSALSDTLGTVLFVSVDLCIYIYRDSKTNSMFIEDYAIILFDDQRDWFSDPTDERG